ncbi:MAG: T9SS type A sorting domain-containing protein [Bacteroidales bacterium]|nr:T9SS type A sorting domain-containing protein [Bacteroidales bacterium]
MKIFTNRYIVAVLAIALSLPMTMYAQFGGGTGTIGDPYLVATPTHLNNVRTQLGSYFIQTANIDLNVSPYNTGDGWEPIGKSSAKFTGNYNGQGYTISNVFINRSLSDDIGLFGYISATAVISRSGVVDVNVTGRYYVGALVGNNEGTVNLCYSTGIVEAFQSAGGLVGYNNGNGSNTGAISNSYSQIYARASSSRAGGLAAWNYYGTITNCYAAGGVSAPSNSGGLLGSVSVGTVTNSYWNSETSAQVSSAAGSGLTMAQMQQASSFTGWDFGSIWAINSGSSYPYLQSSQQTPAPGPNPFEVSSIQDLDNIRNFMHGHYILTKNLDFNEDSSYDPIGGWEAFKTSVTTGEGFTPIGVTGNRFNGLLDGNGYSIRNLYINRPTADEVGLIGYSNGAGEVRNLGVIDVNISGEYYVGAIVGYSHGTVSTSYSTGIVEAFQTAGGLVGINNGLAATDPGLIKNSYSQAYAQASSSRAGGLSGWNYYGEIINSYATGGVSSPSNTGGLVGTSSSGSTTNSYWNSETSAQVGSNGGDGLTMAQMKQASSFSGWDFANIWAINPGSSYPYLQENTQVPPPAPIPFEVSSIQDLDNIRNLMHGHYILTKDLDFNDDGSYDPVGGWEAFKTSVTTGLGFAPIGVTGNRFNGLLDGDGYSISNLYINRPTADDIALIGYSNGAGEVRNLGVTDVNITGRYYVGAIKGYSHGTIATSYSTGEVMAVQTAGGLVGINNGLGATDPGLIINCYSLANAHASSTRAGGLSAWNYYGEIINSYAAGAVSSPSEAGGLVGTTSAGTSLNSYWNLETAAVNSSTEGASLTIWEMKLELAFSGWDFDNIWSIVEKASYPYLINNTQSPLPGPLPVEIHTIQDLDNIRNNLKAHYILMNDLDFDDDNSYEQLGNWEDFKTDMTTGTGFLPIGSTASPFHGFFDGNGFVIENLFINRPATSNIGLFGLTSPAGRISRTSILDADITGGRYVGAVAGYNNGTILTSYSTGSVTNTVSGDAGGIAGINDGLGTSIGLITDCYSRASITGLARVGGLVGWNYYADIINSYSTGAVSGTSSVGGLTGSSSSATTSNSYWDTQTSGRLTSDGGLGRTTAEMTSPYDANTFNTWNFIHLWAEDAAYSDNDGYPFFGFPFEYNSPNLVIEDGNSACFDSEDKVVLAGGGTNFLLESGASLELAAVNSIILKDGFRAHAGSYGHFFIDPNGDFCNPPNLLSIEDESFIEPIHEVAEGKSTNLYPNPTSGNFTLNLIGFDNEVPTIVEIFGTMGERVFTDNLSGKTNLHFNLEDRPNGMYIVRVLNGDDVSVQKIIKR